MTEKRFTIKEFSTLDAMSSLDVICDNGIELPSSTACDLLNEQHEVIGICENRIAELRNENEQLKAQLYCDDEEGVCNICKHHYLVKDDETELGYYNSRCKKGHYECARVSLKYCEDFEEELKE